MEPKVADPELKLALLFTPGVTANTLRRMEEYSLSAEDFFTLPSLELSEKLGASRRAIFSRSARDKALIAARAELKFINTHSIRLLLFGEEDYPYRLAECDDAPPVLFALGDCDLSPDHPVGIVGTRKPTPYGTGFCTRLVEDAAALLGNSLCVISGLAYGIDASAHRAALEAGVPTIAVVAHGLHTIYPAQHRELAKKILDQGGAIVTRYPSGTPPYRPRFLERNRVVAGLADSLVVAESPVKGGAMSTAAAAFAYGREVMALPGRISDETSKGCNLLISSGKASLISSAVDLINISGWSRDAVAPSLQPVLPVFEEEEDPQRKSVLEALRSAGAPLSADDLHLMTSMAMPKLLSLLTEMEFDGLLNRYPGNRFEPA